MSGGQETTQIQAAIDALEAQRALLGDAVVEPALAALREKLFALESRATSTQQRKQATVLFADVSGFTALSEMMDVEIVAGIMNDLWALVDIAITGHGGRIDKHIGDAVMALWGAETAREDDPEMAVRGALAMQEAVAEFCETHSAPLALRVGINTGPVLLGRVGTTGEFTAMGDAVNLANRLEHAAPVGGVLISHDTFRHIRGLFDVADQAPISVKGKTEPVRTYLIQQAKPRAFRMATRGVEGVETRMVGRDNELGLLKDAFLDAALSAEPRIIAVAGDAGVGKSRLLFEFDNWIVLRPEPITYFKGRGTLHTQKVPFSLFHDLFAFQFDIRDSDSAAVALEKFQAGMAGYIEPDQAAIAGHWLGFDFSASEAVGRLLGDPGFAETAQGYLTRAFRGLLATGPVVVLLEDIHWADDPSLGLVLNLMGTAPAAPLLVVAATRPVFFENHPDWDEGMAGFRKIALAPLSKRASRTLVDEILQRVDDIPESLCDLIVDAAEGNPFYVEELVKMLIEQGVIERGIRNYELGIRNEDSKSGETEEQESLDSSLVISSDDRSRRSSLDTRWQVRADKLAGIKVPPTLISLLQARLDRLSPPEREALQRASVVGRLFWDECVADLSHSSLNELRSIFESVQRRELIFHRERSAFIDAEEYIFKHNLLRDVAYETVLLKNRVALHGRVARWLETHAGERLGEYLSLIAEHYIQAGEELRAAALLERSGYEAAAIGANHAARLALENALALRERAGDTSSPATARTLTTLGHAYRSLGDFAAAEATLERGLQVARAGGDRIAEAEAQAHLAFVLADCGLFERAQTSADTALELARATGDPPLALALLAAASVAWSRGELDSAEVAILEALDRATRAGDVNTSCRALNTLGNIALNRRQLERADEYYASALEQARAIGNLSMETTLLINRGNNAYLREDYEAARTYNLAAKERVGDLGEKGNMPIVLINLAQTNLKLGEIEAARLAAHETLSLAKTLGMQPMILWGIFLSGQILIAEGKTGRGLALFGLARAQPSPEHQLLVEIDEELARLPLSKDDIESGLAGGAALDLDTVVHETLNGNW
jgi:class 3 adenylate cyclase/tetratricopeptide (TPR) repeat protein